MIFTIIEILKTKMRIIFEFTCRATRTRRIGSLREPCVYGRLYFGKGRPEMGVRTSYKSKHRDQILSILQENEKEHMTAGQILDELRASGISIGVATIYRQLERMVEEGLVNKYIIDANSPACFEYVDRQTTCGEECFHCKCEKCGKVVHIERKSVEAAMQSLSGSEGNGFELDCTRTLFYGICGDCRRRK